MLSGQRRGSEYSSEVRTRRGRAPQSPFPEYCVKNRSYAHSLGALPNMANTIPGTRVFVVYEYLGGMILLSAGWYYKAMMYCAVSSSAYYF